MSSSRVLVSGGAWYDCCSSIAQGCRAIGLDAADHTYAIGHDGTPLSIIRYYLSKLPGIGRKSPSHGYSASLLEAVEEARPDILLLIRGSRLLPGVLPRVRSIQPDVKIVLWTLDSVANIPLYDGINNDVDVLALFEPADLGCESVRRFPAALALPMGFDPAAYFPAPAPSRFDVLFCGALYPERVDLLRRVAVAARQRGWRLGIFGSSYRRLSFARRRYAKQEPLLAQYLVGRSVSPAEANQLYNESIAVLNTHHPQSVLGFNPRTVEVLAAGACELLDRRETLSETFPDRESVLYYDDADDLVERIAELLASPDLQQRLRENGPRYARGHTFAIRMSALMTFLGVEHQIPVADLAPDASSDKEA